MESKLSILEQLILKYPESNWNWEYLSMNIGISMEFIEKNPFFPWRFSYIIWNPNLTMEFIEKTPFQRIKTLDIRSELVIPIYSLGL